MTATPNSEQHGIEDWKQYRQMMDRLMGIGAVGLIIVTAVWWLFLPEDMVIFAGLGIYCLSILGYVAINFDNTVRAMILIKLISLLQSEFHARPSTPLSANAMTPSIELVFK